MDARPHGIVYAEGGKNMETSDIPTYSVVPLCGRGKEVIREYFSRKEWETRHTKRFKFNMILSDRLILNISLSYLHFVSFKCKGFFLYNGKVNCFKMSMSHF